MVEHGNAGAAAAAPLGRDIMADVLPATRRATPKAPAHASRTAHDRWPTAHDLRPPPDPRRTLLRPATKLWQISWSYVLLLCLLAGVGYVALYSAAGGSPEPYATKHILRFASAWS